MTQDELLEKLERKLNNEYRDTESVIRQKIAYYTKDFDKDNKQMQKRVLSGEISEKEYRAWYKHEVNTANWCKKMTGELTDDMAKASSKASEIINGYTDDAFSIGCLDANKEIADYTSFDLVDKRQVETILDNNRRHLPQVNPNIPKNKQWSEKRIKSALLQSAIKGESIPKLAKRLEVVVGMGKTSAIRNARTMMTCSHNMGRMQVGYEAKARGIDIQKKWRSTYDNRTRHSHALLQGEVVEVEDTFSNGLMYPAEEGGDPAEVYNCRCRFRYVHEEPHGGMSEDEFKERVGEVAEEKEAWRKGEEYVPKKKTKVTATNEATAKSTVKDNAYYQNETQKTLMQAYDSHRDINDLRSLSADEVGADFFGVSYGKLDVRTTQAMTEALGELTQQYDTTLKDIRIMTQSECLSRSGSFAFTYHNYETDVSTIAINPLKCKDYEGLRERLLLLQEKGWSAKVSAENIDKYIITHEFGHTLIDMGTKLDPKRNWVDADYEKIKSARKEINKIYDRYMGEMAGLEDIIKKSNNVMIMSDDMDEWAKALKEGQEAGKRLKNIKISDYSMAQSDEFMAEAFTHRMLGGGSNKYVDEVMEIIDRYFKKGK